ncbi:hypothetical protein [Pseudochrobactrum kiredjianiae]|uniref:Uncharacterized protein n=1 Tax=Pseudochrobactrum kiredjianiae TaxID=386305 RepID=A0ABW3V3R3_9HYPH|nr:hypothetical protein [Pseudochrobactrum kiredjianiae]MDM7852694.1 hypothetical protein [Pseudochrobactrum kiredjianiae]
MRRDEYWKNFNLGTELDISGRFLYNGLQVFHEMQDFSDEEDAFEFLYFIAVGVERLLKIAVILTEHDQSIDQAKFEQGLITHNHQALISRIKSRHNLNLHTQHNDLIAILSTFYKSHRYGRYSLESVAAPARERNDLVAFLESHLSTNIETSDIFNITKNEKKYKKFIGKTLSKIVTPVFKIIVSEASRLNLNTTEIKYRSKASKIFYNESFDFESEDFLHAELLAYFLSSSAKGPNSNFIRETMKPLPFDPALEGEYLQALRFEQAKIPIIDEMEEHYNLVENFKERKEIIETAVSLSLHSYIDDEDEEFNFEDASP